MRNAFLISLVLTCLWARADDKPTNLQFGLFVDSYYAFDFNEPGGNDRPFTTVPTRQNEFAVNLAYAEGKLSNDRLRGRLALQTGTSVRANYSAEKRDAGQTGAQLADILMWLQEAYAGYRLSEGLWIDAGIYFSHIGMESFISRDNWTYTRSLVADFSPYYQAGVRLSYAPSEKWLFQLHVMNGWQNVIENNSDKALGTQVTFQPSRDFSVTYNTFFGRESDLRFFNDFVAKYRLLEAWEAGITFDVGMQKRAGLTSFATWSGASLMNRFTFSTDRFLAVRLEYYSDPEGVIVPTSKPGNFQALGASVNYDWQLLPQLLWRTELRYLKGKDSIFPSKTGPQESTVFTVTSLALTL